MVRPGLELTTSRSAVLHPTNGANQAALTLLAYSICTRFHVITYKEIKKLGKFHREGDDILIRDVAGFC